METYIFTSTDCAIKQENISSPGRAKQSNTIRMQYVGREAWNQIVNAESSEHIDILIRFTKSLGAPARAWQLFASNGTPRTTFKGWRGPHCAYSIFTPKCITVTMLT